MNAENIKLTVEKSIKELIKRKSNLRQAYKDLDFIHKSLSTCEDNTFEEHLAAIDNAKHYLSKAYSLLHNSHIKDEETGL